MSFSFKVQASTKAAVVNLVAAKLDEVIAGGQRPHEVDRAAAIKNVQEALALVTNTDPARDFAVGVWGSVSMSETFGVTAVSISCTAELATRPTPAVVEETTQDA